MSLANKQRKIASRGLGKDTLAVGDFFTTETSIKSVVFEEKLYYPTTGVFSREENIPGWYWDRTYAQEYSSIYSSEIRTSIGGYNYNLREGISREHYQGAMLNGCDLIEINNQDYKWNPVIKTGLYSIYGKDRPLYSSQSICKRIENTNLSLDDYASNLDNITVAIYYRDKNFVKQIFREYKEDNVIYKYDISENNILTIENHVFQIGSSSVVLEDTASSFEDVGIVHRENQEIYLKYFPVKNLEIRHKANDFISLQEGQYEVDYDYGIIKIIDSQIKGQLYCSYSAIPRIDIEINPDAGFKSRIDLKPHNWKQSNGFIEISTEDRHVSKIELEVDNNELTYGAGSTSLIANVYNSLGQAVDEIKVDIEVSEIFKENQEVFFEGNLLKFTAETNSSGEVSTVVTAPLKNESSSLYFDEYSGGFPIPESFLARRGADLFDNTYIFEILKVDPILGSMGLTLEIEAYNAANNYLEVKSNLKNQDYKIFRNGLESEIVRIESGNDLSEDSYCFKTFYNSGFLLVNDGALKIPIKNITEDKIYLTDISEITKIYLLNPIGVNFGSLNFKVFRKNENSTSEGVERLLYRYDDKTGLYKPVRPTQYSNNTLRVNSLANRTNDTSLVKGFRVVAPRKTKIIAKCIDPATGNEITSNEEEIILNLSASCKDELSFPESKKIGIASYLSLDAKANNIYIE